jgi:3-hydroxyisobutyrate dehydrogenase-like beta-hydroxyacid dehydrogenase
LLAVTVDQGGVLTVEGAAPSLLIDCSTVSSEASAQVRDAAVRRGCDFLAAPVSGNPKVAAAGELTFAVSGSPDAFQHAEPLLHVLGSGVTYVGAGEIARLVKLCHNVLLGVVAQSLVEVTLLAQKGGTTRAAFLDFLNNSVAGSRFTRYKSPALVNLDLTPTFTMSLMRKDFDIALDAARELEVPMHTAAQVATLISAAIGAGHGEEDFAALILEQARGAGMTLQPENVTVDDGLSTES